MRMKNRRTRGASRGMHIRNTSHIPQNLDDIRNTADIPELSAIAPNEMEAI